MQKKRIACMVMVCVLLIGTIAVPASAEETTPAAREILLSHSLNPLATDSFSMSIPAKSKALDNSSFPMKNGETITIKASYSPYTAKVDVGYVAPDGKFYCVPVTDGSIDLTMQVNQSGNYTIQIRNNSNVEIHVTGTVNY